MKKYISFTIRLILGTVFLLSGILKGVDPMGLTYKIKEFLIYISLEDWVYFAKVLSISICSIELALGILLILGIKNKIVGKFCFTIMLFFTLFTFYLLLEPNSLSNCGCFGDFLNLSHTTTFIKNVVLLSLTIINLYTPSPKSINYKYKLKSSLLTLAVIFYSLSIPIYSLQQLAPFNFLPYNKGDNLINNSSFIIFDNDLNIITSNYISSEKNTLLVVIKKPEKIINNEDLIFENIKSIQGDSLNILIVSKLDKDQTIKILPTLIPYKTVIFQADETLLKSLLRCDNGIIFIQKGIIQGKWNLLSFKNKRKYTIDKIVWKSKKEKSIYICWIIIGFVILLYLKIKLNIIYNPSK